MTMMRTHPRTASDHIGGDQGDRDTGPRTSSVTRVTQILDLFLARPERLMLQDVATHTGLPRSTAFRIMNQLVAVGWLEHGRGGYRLGARLRGLGIGTGDPGVLRHVAAGTLNRLHVGTGAVVHLGTLEGGFLHYLDKLGGPRLDSLPSRVGTKVPADTTPMGRAMLATLDLERVEALVATTVDHPRRRPLDMAVLHDQLHAVRRRSGVDIVREGGPRRRITALGAAVRGPDGMLAAIGLGCTDGRLTPEGASPIVLSAARRITDDLGGPAA